MSKRKVKFDFDPLAGRRRGTSREAQDRAETRVAKFVDKKVKEFMQASNSPVSGQPNFSKLSKAYAKKKRAAGESPMPNLFLEGDLYSAIVVEKKAGGGLRLTVEDDQQGKADGHCKFNKANNARIPKRSFVPDEKKEEKFKAEIERGIKKIVDEELG